MSWNSLTSPLLQDTCHEWLHVLPSTGYQGLIKVAHNISHTSVLNSGCIQKAGIGCMLWFSLWELSKLITINLSLVPLSSFWLCHIFFNANFVKCLNTSFAYDCQGTSSCSSVTTFSWHFVYNCSQLCVKPLQIAAAWSAFSQLQLTEIEAIILHSFAISSFDYCITDTSLDSSVILLQSHFH